MSITIAKTGTATAGDLQTMTIVRDGATWTAQVTYAATALDGNPSSRSATWVLSSAEKTAITNSLAPGALAAINA